MGGRGIMNENERQNLIRKAIIDCDTMIIHYYKEQIIKTYERLISATTAKEKEEERKRIERDTEFQQEYINRKLILKWCLEPTNIFPFN